MDSVNLVGLHTNPWGCGIAKFNLQLANKLEVKIIPLIEWLEKPSSQSILSLGFHEFTQLQIDALNVISTTAPKGLTCIVHSLSQSQEELIFLRKAARLFALNHEISFHLSRNHLAHSILKTPSLVSAEAATGVKENTFKLFSFGMGHKMRFSLVQRLVMLAKNSGLSPELSFSSAIHEGTNSLKNLEETTETLRQESSIKIRFLGFLSDEALVNEMVQSHSIFKFFDFGIRDNSTTAMLALDLGLPLITNTDRFSPKWLKHGYNFLDIGKLNKLPSASKLEEIGKLGQSEYRHFDPWREILSSIKTF